MTAIFDEAALATEFADTDKHPIHTARPTVVHVTLKYMTDYDPDALFTALATLGVISADKTQPIQKPIMDLIVE